MASGPLLAVATISKLLPRNYAEIMASMVLESSTARTLTFVHELILFLNVTHFFNWLTL